MRTSLRWPCVLTSSAVGVGSLSLALSTLGCGSSSGSQDGEQGRSTSDGGTSVPTPDAFLVDETFTPPQPDSGGNTATETCNGLDDDNDGSVDEGCACQPGQTQACYGGLARQAGVGVCVMGTQTCESSGEFSKWGPCTDWGPAAAEVCQDALDQDCDGADPQCPAECGNGRCDSDETCSLCASDCGSCPPAPCGDSPSGTSQSRTMYQTGSVSFGGQCATETQTRTCDDGQWSNWSGSFAFESCVVGDAAGCNVPGYGSLAHGQQISSYVASNVACGQTCQQVSISCDNGHLTGPNQYIAGCSVQACASCNLPGYGVLADGQQVSSYVSSSVACGQVCQQVSISCNNGALKGGSNYTAGCSVQQCPKAIWPMGRYNAEQTGRTSLLGPATSSKKWEFTGTGGMLLAPTIAHDGTIYVAGNGGLVYAIAPNGTKRWERAIGQGWSRTAITSDGNIVLSEGSGELTLFAPNGTELWSVPGLLGGAITLSPDGTIFVGKQGRVDAVSPNGTRKWSVTDACAKETYVPPAVGSDGTVYFGRCAHTPAGTLKWSDAKANSGLWTWPSLGADGTLYLADANNRLYAYSPSGTKKWEIVVGKHGLFSAPAIGADGTIYLGAADQILYAISPNGTQKWTKTLTFQPFSSISVGSDGALYFAGGGSDTLASYSSTGLLRWSVSLGANAMADSPAIGTGSVLYVSCGPQSLCAYGQ